MFECPARLEKELRVLQTLTRERLNRTLRIQKVSTEDETTFLGTTFSPQG
jgi:hypothetical protein